MIWDSGSFSSIRAIWSLPPVRGLSSPFPGSSCSIPLESCRMLKEARSMDLLNLQRKALLLSGKSAQQVTGEVVEGLEV